MPEYRSHPDDLPVPTPEMVLWRVSVEAYLATAPRKRAEAFLYRISELLASEEALSQVLPIRPKTEEAAVRDARLQAMAMFRQYLPVFLRDVEMRGT